MSGRMEPGAAGGARDVSRVGAAPEPDAPPAADAPEPALEDNETHSRWQISDGRAIDGPLTGTRLERVVAHPAFWFGWYGFFPDSTVWRLSR